MSKSVSIYRLISMYNGSDSNTSARTRFAKPLETRRTRVKVTRVKVLWRVHKFTSRGNLHTTSQNCSCRCSNHNGTPGALHGRGHPRYIDRQDHSVGTAVPTSSTSRRTRIAQKYDIPFGPVDLATEWRSQSMRSRRAC